MSTNFVTGCPSCGGHLGFNAEGGDILPRKFSPMNVPLEISGDFKNQIAYCPKCKIVWELQLQSIFNTHAKMSLVKIL